jgi:beta-galactosidase
MIIRNEGGLRIWLNGNVLGEGSGTSRSRGGNFNIEALPLKQGWNHFLIKAVQGESTGWTFSARLRSNDIRFLDLLKSSLVNPDQK